MASRHTTRSYPDLRSFLEDLEGSLAQSAIMLPPQDPPLDVHNELRLDLDIPYLGKVGPLRAQVVLRDQDGGVALRIISFPANYSLTVARAHALVADVQAWLGRAAGANVQGGRRLPAAAAPPIARAAAAPPMAGADGPRSMPPAPAAAGDAPKALTRGFPVPDLSQLDPLASGDLSDDSLRDNLVRFSAQARTGLLTIRTPDGRVRYGFWDHGGPVGFRTDPVQENEVLGVLLFKADQITREQLQESLRVMESDGLRQGEALIRMGILTFPQLVMVLGKQTEFLLQLVLAERVGAWTFHDLPAMPERFLPSPLKVAALMYRALVLKAKELRLDQLYESQRHLLDRYVFLDDEKAGILDELRLGATERKLVDVLSSTSYRTREIFGVSPMSRAQTAAVISALSTLGFLVFRDAEDAARTLARTRLRIEKKKSQVDKSSLFDVIEVHWIALPHEIEQAYRRVRAEYSTEENRGLPAELMADLESVQRRIEVAYETLSHDGRRREYRETLIEKVMIQQSAELLAKRADMALMRKDVKDASTCLHKALELIPNSAEYRDALRRLGAGGAGG